MAPWYQQIQGQPAPQPAKSGIVSWAPFPVPFSPPLRLQTASRTWCFFPPKYLSSTSQLKQQNLYPPTRQLILHLPLLPYKQNPIMFMTAVCLTKNT